MKKTLSVFLSLLLVFSVFVGAQSAFAASDDSGACGDTIKYAFDSATGTLTLTGTGKTKLYTSGETSLGRTPWYSYRTEIKKVVVGEGITQLNNYVFSKLTNLTTAVLPSTLTTISMYAFYQDAALSSVNFKDTKLSSIGMNAFEECKALTQITLPETMQEIGNFAFRNAGIKTVNFPDACTKIGTSAFYGCAMSTLELPETITSVGTTAFANNSFLLRVYVYNRDLTFGMLDPFANCQPSLTIYGYGGSTAQAYAEEKGYNFVPLDTCEHSSTHTVVTQAPTCTEKGKQDVICDLCNTVLRTESISATGHDLQIIQVDDQSEATGHIFNYYRCAKCNDPSTDTIRTTHVQDEDGKYVWVDGYYTDSVITEASCTQTGRILRRCTVDVEEQGSNKCTAMEYINTPAPGHQVAEWTVTQAPTCTADGSRTGTCTVCGEAVTEAIQGGHSYVCSQGEAGENGHRTDTYVCSVCGDAYESLVHLEWVEGFYTTRTIATASCIMTGSSIDTCTVEGCTQTPRTNIVPASGHQYRYVSCDGTTCNYACANCARTATYTLENVNKNFISNMGKTSDHLFGYYFDINNDNWVNARDYVLIERLNNGIGVTLPDETTQPETDSAPPTE